MEGMERGSLQGIAFELVSPISSTYFNPRNYSCLLKYILIVQAFQAISGNHPIDFWKAQLFFFSFFYCSSIIVFIPTPNHDLEDPAFNYLAII